MEEIIVLLAAGVLYLGIEKMLKSKNKMFMVEPISLTILFLTFFKIGSLLFGSGYVLISFIQTEFVQKLGVLTNSQVIDAVTVGEFTPGPVLTTATFIGYQLQGVVGGLVATAGIFMPSFILTLLLGSMFNKIKGIESISHILKGVATGSLALIGIIVINLGIETLINWQTIAIFVVSLLGMVKYKKSPIIFIVLGLFVGLILSICA